MVTGPGRWEERERLFRREKQMKNDRKQKGRRDNERDERDRWAKMLHDKRAEVERLRREGGQGVESEGRGWVSWAPLVAVAAAAAALVRRTQIVVMTDYIFKKKRMNDIESTHICVLH